MTETAPPNSTEECPLDSQLRRVLGGQLSDAELAAVESHLSRCELCQQRLERLAGLLATPSETSRITPTVQRLIDEAIDKPPTGGFRVPTSRTPGGLQPPTRAADTVPIEARLLKQPRAGLPTTLGPYQVTGLLGEGGMGVVLAAHDPQLNRRVAIKLLKPSTATAESHERFLREARAVASVKHPHIVTIHAVDVDHDIPYLVMEYIEGESLAEWIERDGPLPLPSLVSVARQTAAALQAAHDRGLIHRDIKPGNILLEGPDRSVKVTDFGLARSSFDPSLTSSDVIVGTPQYMSPEQAAGEPLDARADLFSLGVVLYAACTGASPFQATTALATLRRIGQGGVPPLHERVPDLPDWFSNLVAWLMAQSADDRPQSARQLIELLDQGPSSTDDRSAVRPSTAPSIGQALRRTPAPFELTQQPNQQLPGPESSGARFRAARFGGGSLKPRRWLAAGLLGLAVAAGIYGFVRTEPDGGTIGTTGTDPARPASEAASAGSAAEPATTTSGPLVLLRTGQAFPTVRAAVAAAADGDVIEVRHPGPLIESGIRSDGKTVTLRGVGTRRPIFRAREELQTSSVPFWTAEGGSLTVENIELQWAMQLPRIPAGDDDATRGNPISITGGHLTVRNCRILSARSFGAISAVHGDVTVEQSHISTVFGPCIRWVPQGPYELSVVGSVLEGWAGLSLATTGTLARTDSVPLRFSRTTVVTQKGLQLIFVPESSVRYSMRSEDTVWDVQQLVSLAPARPAFPRNNRLRTADDLADVVQSMLTWSGQRNVYREGAQWIARSPLRAGANRSDLTIDDWSRWEKMWQGRETQSTLAVIEYSPRRPGAENRPRPILQIRNAAQGGSEPVEIDPSTVGAP